MDFDALDEYLADLDHRSFVLDRLRLTLLRFRWTLRDVISIANLDRSDTAACDYVNARSTAALARIPPVAMRNLACLAFRGLTMWKERAASLLEDIQRSRASYSDDFLLARETLVERFAPRPERVSKTLAKLLADELPKARSVLWMSPCLPGWAMASSKRAGQLLATPSYAGRPMRYINKGATLATGLWRKGLLRGYRGTLQLMMSSSTIQRSMRPADPHSGVNRSLVQRLYLKLFDERPGRELLLTDDRTFLFTRAFGPRPTPKSYLAMIDERLVIRAAHFTAPIEIFKRPESGTALARWDMHVAELQELVEQSRRAPVPAADVLSRLVYESTHKPPARENGQTAVAPVDFPAPAGRALSPAAAKARANLAHFLGTL